MTGRLAALHRTGELDRPAVKQELLGQRGLTRIGWEMMAKVRRLETSVFRSLIRQLPAKTVHFTVLGL